MHTSADRLQEACEQLKAVAKGLTEDTPQQIDFRERVRIERYLFIVIKEFCRRYLGYDLRGLGDVHHEELNDWMESSGCVQSLQHFVRNVFELRVFLIALSSANAYVQGDALSRASLTKKNVLMNLSRSLNSLAEKAIEVKGEQRLAPDETTHG